MANKEHVALLKERVNGWNQWRRENSEIRPDLGRANLNGVDLTEANLSGANLSDADLHEATLHEATLRGADLRRTNLNKANLSSADLNEATLREATLRGADLSNADLGGADLIKATLNNADLGGAKLSGANIIEANLSNAHLDGADFSNADLSQIVFGNSSLSKVSGLDTCNYYGPSSIDNRTFRRSGPLPVEFLRGCGLDDWEIEATKLYDSSLSAAQVADILDGLHHKRTDNPIQYYSAFISYSHADKDFARYLHDTLQDKGIRCWLDEHQMLPGDDIYEQIDRGIRLWDKVLLCCSKASLTSWWVDNEIDTAFEKERILMRERSQKVLALIPLDLDGYLYSDEWKSSGKERQVKSRIAANFAGWKPDTRDGDTFDAELKRLERARRTGDGGREPSPEARI